MTYRRSRAQGLVVGGSEGRLDEAERLGGKELDSGFCYQRLYIPDGGAAHLHRHESRCAGVSFMKMFCEGNSAFRVRSYPTVICPSAPQPWTECTESAKALARVANFIEKDGMEFWETACDKTH